ncbi:MAG: hypothetical protein ACE5H3_03530 [Planctomycetota bacterium]
MLRILRTFAKALLGRVEPLEISLGVFFGLWLGILPMREVDPGTGLLGLNALWLLILLCLFAWKASLPFALLSGGLGVALGRFFLDGAGQSLGRFLIEGPLPEGLVRFFYRSLPSAQLHTWWGLGALLLGLVISAGAAWLLHRVLVERLPGWRKRVQDSRLGRFLSRFFLFRFLGWLIR